MTQVRFRKAQLKLFLKARDDTYPNPNDYLRGPTNEPPGRSSTSWPRDDLWGNVPEDVLVRQSTIIDDTPFQAGELSRSATTVSTGWSDDRGTFRRNDGDGPLIPRESRSVPMRPRLLASSSVSGDPPVPMGNSTERIRWNSRIRMVHTLLASSRFHSHASPSHHNFQISDESGPFVNPDTPAAGSTLLTAQDARDLNTEVEAMMGWIRSGSQGAAANNESAQLIINRALNGTQSQLSNQSTTPITSPERSALPSPQPPTTQAGVNNIMGSSTLQHLSPPLSTVPTIREPESLTPPQASLWSSLNVAAHMAIAASPPLPPLTITAAQQTQMHGQVHQQPIPGVSSPLLQRSPPLAAVSMAHSESASAITSPRLGSRGRRDFSPGFGAIRVRSPRAVSARSNLGTDAGADITGGGRLPPAAIENEGSASGSISGDADNARPGDGSDPANAARVVKTRLQLQGELEARSSGHHERQYKGALSAFVKIARTEGMRGIQRGLAPGYVYQTLMNGTRLGFYGPIRDLFMASGDAVFGEGIASSGVGRAVAMVLSGAGCGALGAAIGSPFFLIKTRMQSYSPNIRVGAQHSYVLGGLRKSLVHIYTKEGLAGLWRGADASMLRTAVGSGVQLSTYDASKEVLVRSGWFNVRNGDGGAPLHFAASAFTSLFVCIAMNPFDVISTRMYNQHRDANGKGSLYTSLFDCMAKTLKTEGPSALYKGFLAHYLRIGYSV
ncbi:Mitochondrial oxaloacetate carrier protein [Entophlyctis luteolus]|nr:Mitochondrial oxaloacetate carrier protein [Entophlyctis luteolus]